PPRVMLTSSLSGLKLMELVGVGLMITCAVAEENPPVFRTVKVVSKGAHTDVPHLDSSTETVSVTDPLAAIVPELGLTLPPPLEKSSLKDTCQSVALTRLLLKVTVCFEIL